MKDKQIKSILSTVWSMNYYTMELLRIVEEEVDDRLEAEKSKEPREFC